MCSDVDPTLGDRVANEDGRRCKYMDAGGRGHG